MPIHSNFCPTRQDWRNTCKCYHNEQPKDQRIADKVLLRIKAIEEERDSLFRIIGQCVVKGEDYSAHLSNVNTADARIQELRWVLKGLDAS